MNVKNKMCMKKMGWMVAMVLFATAAWAQSKSADQRMQQDIEVAENILGTLLRQETGRRGFFPVEAKGTYVAGYGVTFRLPLQGGWGTFAIAGVAEPEMVEFGPGTVTYSYSTSEAELAREEAREVERMSRDERDRARAAKAPRAISRDESDSAAIKAKKRFMDVARNFLADYGDVISGLKAEERIVITNRGDDFEPGFATVWFNGRKSPRQLLSVEAKRGDIEQLKQGKISRADFLNRLKVVDTQSVEDLDPDLEVLSSLFGRLYREDLSRTYYVQGNLNYERLKDFGAMYYMKVYSSMEMEGDRYMMPTLDLRDVPQAERDQKVKELYPKFESELKENIVEYGRTLRSLKDDEQLVFQVRLTKCTGCGIPSMVELSIKAGALKDYGSGKATKEATVAKITIKKTGVQ